MVNEETKWETPTAEGVDCIHIELTRGYFAVIDIADSERVLSTGLMWTADPRPSGVVYARAMVTVIPGRGGRRVPLYLHRFIAGAQDGQVVDHLDFDGLNNRSKNLRICSARENVQHRRSRKVIKGVRASKNGKGWWAIITPPQAEGGNGTPKYLGTYRTMEAAGRAYDIAAIELFGEFAHTNFPVTEYNSILIAEVRASMCHSTNIANGGYRGVYWKKSLGKWTAQISGGEVKPDGKRKQIHIGVFSNQVDAALAYDARALEAFGAMARLNFPEVSGV